MSEREWPERPARAGTNPVNWDNMTVIFRDTPPPQAEDGDRLETPEGTYERRGGEWVLL